MAHVAWIGLGVMGSPMAGHLAQKGRDEVVVYNRNAAKAQGLVDVKVMSFSETLSALKLVIPVAERPKSAKGRKA